MGVGCDGRKIHPGRVHLHNSVVPQDGVAAILDADGIGTHAAKDRVVAFVGSDVIVAARGSQRVRGAVCRHQPRSIEAELAVVAENDVVARASGDVVTVVAGRCRVRRGTAPVGAAEDNIATFTCCNEVIAPHAEVGRINCADQVHKTVGLVAESPCAEGLHDVRAGVEILHPASVAEDEVVAATTCDVVLALAAEYDKRKRGCGGIDRVVVGARDTGVIVAERSLGIQDKESVG